MSDLILCLMGPTAAGKTDLACELVQQFPLEIISVDSAMIYRGMDIGTAKPDRQTLSDIPHHLIDVLDPPDIYSAAQFCSDVSTLFYTIQAKRKVPLLVGGTMMYYRALQQGLANLPEANASVRQTILAQAQQYGWPHLHQSLAEVDPNTAAKIHPHDSQRIQRALEIYRTSGKTLSHWLQEPPPLSGFTFTNLVLMPDNRAWLHERISLRFQQMLAQGLIQEVESLVERWQLNSDYPSMRSVGYRQVLAYLQGEYDKTQLIEKGIAATRQLAKRQLTWLRHWPNGIVYPAEDASTKAKIIDKIGKILDNSSI